MWILGLKGLKETRKLHGLVFFNQIKKRVYYSSRTGYSVLKCERGTFVCRR